MPPSSIKTCSRLSARQSFGGRQPTKTVRFGRGRNLSQIQTTLSRLDMTTDERTSSFYSSKEMKAMVDHAKTCAARSVKEEATQDQQPNYRKLCTRGLERYVARYKAMLDNNNNDDDDDVDLVVDEHDSHKDRQQRSMNRQSRRARNKSVTAVRTLQALGSTDVQIAAAYSVTTSTAVLEAFARAEQDERCARHYYRRSSSSTMALHRPSISSASSFSSFSTMSLSSVSSSSTTSSSSSSHRRRSDRHQFRNMA